MSAAAQPVPNAAPARSGVYPGWFNMAVAGLAMVGALPGRTQGLGLVTEPLIADLQIDRVSFAAINLWATLIGSLFCLPCGRLVDRIGSRLVLTAVIVSLAVTVLGMSAATGWLALAVGVTLTRGLGQSALSVVSLTLVGKWFGRRLNYAMGTYALLVGIGFIAAFPSVGSAVLSLGWRAAWSAIGWTLLAILMPLSWLVARDGPADRSVEFDSAGPGDTGAACDLTLEQALRGPAFWVFALSSSLFGLVYSGISLFNQSILEQRGFDAGVYHEVLVISSMLGLVANFAGGWVASRWPIQRLTGIGTSMLACALWWLPLVRTHTHVMLYGALMGIAGGIVTVVFFSVWGQVYGRTHLGKIQGCAQMMTVFASATGPLVFAATLARTGSYDGIFYSVAVVVAALGIASWWVRMPSRQIAISEEP